jgi:hypothetical protein
MNSGHKQQETTMNAKAIVWVRVDGFLRETPAVVTDEHAASSHGLPVVVVDGEVIDPTSIVIHDPDDAAAEWAQRGLRLAGWTDVRVTDFAG